MNVPFYSHGLGPDAAQAVADVLGGPFLTSGAVGRAVEDQLRAFFSVPHAALTNSWTNGAVAVLLALDIGPGDEVIVPAMTFAATANVAALLGAKPVFVDVDPATLLMTPEGVRAALSPRTRAVIPVHLYGQMVDVARLRREGLAGHGHVAIIEDCAHCFEGLLDGEPPGRHSDAAIFSFYATKNVTCGEGGAVITRRDDLYQALLQTRLHGMSAGAADRFKGGSYGHWDMLRLGCKANLPDLLAALLPPQIATVRDRLAEREALAQRYETAFAGTALRLPAPVPNAVHARHLFPVGLPAGRRDRALNVLSQAGIGATVNYRAVTSLAWYREAQGTRPEDFPVATAWGDATISLPLFPGLTEAQQDHVIATLCGVLEEDFL